MTRRMHEDEVDVDEPLVRRLLTAQFPEIAKLSLTIVEPWGTDNAIWRLGSEFVVRLPRIHWAVAQVEHEAEWLPRLAPYLPVDVPEPLHVGQPNEDYPYRWSVHRWVHGVAAALKLLDDPDRFAADLAGFVHGLQRIPSQRAPQARGRARELEAYDAATRRAIEASAHLIDADAALRVWNEALGAEPHEGPRASPSTGPSTSSSSRSRRSPGRAFAIDIATDKEGADELLGLQRYSDFSQPVAELGTVKDRDHGIRRVRLRAS